MPIRCPLSLVLALAAVAPVRGQTPDSSLVAHLVRVHQAAIRIAGGSPELWPGFRADTIPVQYVLPDRGTLLLHWTGKLPAGYVAAGVPGGGWQPSASRAAASTGTAIEQRGVAQVVVQGESAAALVGTTLHEAFHLFERSLVRPGRRFGSGENSFLVSTYPVFDVANEAGMALEGKLLASALAAGTDDEVRRRVRSFVAAREARHRRLGADLADFEVMGELNEGLAEYTLVRALQLAQHDPRFPWPGEARAVVSEHIRELDTITSNLRRSIRFRFYRTGPAMGMLLDRLMGPSWKSRMVEHDLSLQELLAEASGYRDRERQLVDEAERRFDRKALVTQAASGLDRLRAFRHAQVDSILAGPGLELTLSADSLPGNWIGICSFDPQNLLQVDDGVLLHTRFVQPCVRGSFSAEFTTAVVQDKTAGTLQARIGDDSTVRITVRGEPRVLRDGESLHDARDVAVQSPSLDLKAARADLERRGDVLRVSPLASPGE